VQEIREATDYQVPIQLKLGAARVYDDVRMAAKCGPDVIYLDGAEGGTGAGPHVATEETGIPLMAAIPEARRALEDVGLADEIDLVVAGGIRNGADVAKCLALGAKAVAIGHSALMALNCNKELPGVTDYEGTVGVPAGQCYHCHTGRCPVGITTQDPELRKRLVVEDAHHLLLRQARRRDPELLDARAVEELERVSPGRGSGDLTPTEGRIAALVAEGLKNREIAERLFLSVATVEAHLTRIYRKLGIRSRSDLTRLVVDDELSFPAGS